MHILKECYKEREYRFLHIMQVEPAKVQKCIFNFHENRKTQIPRVKKHKKEHRKMLNEERWCRAITAAMKKLTKENKANLEETNVLEENHRIRNKFHFLLGNIDL